MHSYKDKYVISEKMSKTIRGDRALLYENVCSERIT